MNKQTIHHRSPVQKVFSTTTSQRNNSITRNGKQVELKTKPSIATYQKHDNTPMVAYDSGADGHYLSKKDRTKLGLLILIIPDNKVGVANGGTCNGNYVTSLPFPQLSR